MMNKAGNTFGLSVLVLGSALGVTALAQSSTPATDPAAATTSAPAPKANVDDSSTYATGKPLEMQSKIFIPNFTTKSSGTGLGLAMSKTIVEQVKGKIWFETVEGEGTTFYVELPVLRATSQATA